MDARKDGFVCSLTEDVGALKVGRRPDNLEHFVRHQFLDEVVLDV